MPATHPTFILYLVSVTKVLAVLNCLEDEIDLISTFSRSMIFQCCDYFGCESSQIILERLFFYLKQSDCKHFKYIQESISYLQSDSCNTTTDILNAYHAFVENR